MLFRVYLSINEVISKICRDKSYRSYNYLKLFHLTSCDRMFILVRNVQDDVLPQKTHISAPLPLSGHVLWCSPFLLVNVPFAIHFAATRISC